MKRRTIKEILDAESEFCEKVWYNRYLNRKIAILEGREKPAPRDIEEQAQINAKAIQTKYGEENLQWDDFEWGMLNGKLSALRWILGEEWDMLDT